MRIDWWVALAAAMALLTNAAQAAECGSLKLVNMVKLQRLNDGLREMIPVRIDGSEQLFVFDTGSPVTGVRYC